MRSRSIVYLVVSVLAVHLASVAAAQEGPGSSQDDESNVLYALGVSLMRDLAVFNLSDGELKHVMAGMQDSLKGEFRVDPGLYEARIQVLARRRVQDEVAQQNAMAAPFVANELAHPKAIQTPSGMVFTPLEEGRGARPAENDQVRVHFRGFLTDGTEFDSSFRRQAPLEIALAEVIPCWKEGIRMIKPEGKARLICPPELAYGQRGRPPAIPPGATLVFELELLATKQGDALHPNSMKRLPRPRK